MAQRVTLRRTGDRAQQLGHERAVEPVRGTDEPKFFWSEIDVRDAPALMVIELPLLWIDEDSQARASSNCARIRAT